MSAKKRRRREVIKDVNRTGKTILQEADLNGDGVLDVLEATEFLVVDGKLHIEVMISNITIKNITIIIFFKTQIAISHGKRLKRMQCKVFYN